MKKSSSFLPRNELALEEGQINSSEDDEFSDGGKTFESEFSEKRSRGLKTFGEQSGKPLASKRKLRTSPSGVSRSRGKETQGKGPDKRFKPKLFHGCWFY